MVRILKVRRVSYGKSDTPVELREFRSDLGSAVGTMDDWKEFAKHRRYSKVEFTELDGKRWEQFVFEE